MGTTCSTKKKTDLRITINDKEELCSATFYNSIPKSKQFNSQFELFLKLVQLIDIHRRYSDELLFDLNELISLRSKILWLAKHNPTLVKKALIRCIQIVNNLQYNREYQYYFPMLSISLFEQSCEIEKYLRKTSNESTNLNSLNEFKQDDSEI